jgi:hypothetical protein
VPGRRGPGGYAQRRRSAQIRWKEQLTMPPRNTELLTTYA